MLKPNAKYVKYTPNILHGCFCMYVHNNNYMNVRCCQVYSISEISFTCSDFLLDFLINIYIHE